MSTATTSKGMTFVDASKAAMADAMEADERVIVLGEDIADEQGGGTFFVTKGLSSRFGTHRVRTTPISEQAIAGAAIGAAMAGLRPIAEIMFMNFLPVCMDQVTNHAAKLRFMSGGQTSAPITIRTATGSGGGFAGQHSDMLEAWLAHTPGIKVAIPSSPAEAYGLLTSCIFDDDPCVFVENTVQYFTGAKGAVPEPGLRIPLGQANVLRPGADVTVITYGRPVEDVSAVAGHLHTDGIDVEVIDLRTIVPLDYDTVFTSVAKTRRAVIVHEAVTSFGVGAEIAARIHDQLFGELLAPVRRVGAEHCPVPYAPPLEQHYLWTRDKVEAAIRSTVS